MSNHSRPEIELRIKSWSLNVAQDGMSLILIRGAGGTEGLRADGHEDRWALRKRKLGTGVESSTCQPATKANILARNCRKRACSNEFTGMGKGVAGECDAGRLAADSGDVCRNQEHGGGGLCGKQAERCFARRPDEALEGRSENVARRKELHPGNKGSGISGHARGHPKTVWRLARRR